MPTTSTTTNGANGAHDSRSNSIPPVTKILASFVADADPSTYLTPRVRDRLKEYILDFIGVTLAAGSTSDSTPSFLQAVTALGGRTGSSTVLGQGKHFTPQYAGLLNAALGHSLDFDDTYAKGTLHAGVTAIAAGLTQAEINGDGGSSIDDLLVAVAVGYEITCRLGREMGNDAYARGFHNTSTCGVFGAVATICVLKHLPVQTVLDAFGLAGSKAAGSMQYLANGSWNKRLHPGFAVHDAFVAVALAEAGVLGAADIFEGTFGFLHAYSPKPDKDLGHLTSELGERWEFLDTSLKPFPACRMTHGFIEHATRLGREKGHTKASDYKTVTLSLSPANVSVVGAPIPNKVHPANMVDAQFSAYFTAAHSFLYGSGAGVQAYERQKLEDPQIRELSDKITCVGDESIREFGSRIEVEYADGSKEVVDVPYPLGEVQHPFTRDQVDQKFFSLVNPVLGEKRALRIRDVVNEIEKHNVQEILGLLY